MYFNHDLTAHSNQSANECSRSNTLVSDAAMEQLTCFPAFGLGAELLGNLSDPCG